MSIKAKPPHASETPLKGERFTKSWTQFFESVSERIGGTKSYNLGGQLTAKTTSVGNITTGEDDLITYSLEKNTLNNAGDYIEITAFGTFAANANNKQVKLYLGSTQLFATGSVASNGTDWVVSAKIIRTGSATQKSIAQFNGDTVTVTQTADYVSGTENFTTALTIKCTGEATSTNDIVQEGLTINIYPVR